MTGGRTKFQSRIGKSDIVSDVITDIYSSTMSKLANPIILLSVLVIGAVVIIHKDRVDATTFGRWLASHKVFGETIRTHYARALGVLIFLPVLIACRRDQKLLVAGMVTIWVVIVPEASTYEYLLQAVGLHLFLTVRKANTRVLLVILVAAAYALGFIVPHVHVSDPAAQPSRQRAS